MPKKKIILIICDGLGDRPIKEFGNKTPLEAARKPNMNKLAQTGLCGTMTVMDECHVPHSDDAHLTLLGYRIPQEYPGRGPIEAAGVGLELEEGDVAFRANVATMDSNGIVIDRRAGRIESTADFVRPLDSTVIDGVKFIVRPGTAYRAILVMRGLGLSDRITSNDPEFAGKPVLEVKPTDSSKQAKFTADVLNSFLENAYAALAGNPLNIGREREGKPVVNCLLVRGAGYYEKLEPFGKRWGLKAACIAGAGLYKGIGRMLGMDVIKVDGATGMPDTNVDNKIKAAIECLKTHDFVFVHIKPTDSLGEDGNWRGKKDFIEKIDRALSPLLELKGVRVAITADHSTPCECRAHSADPVPILVHGGVMKSDFVKEFSEKACRRGGLGHIWGRDMMKTILNL